MEKEYLPSERAAYSLIICVFVLYIPLYTCAVLFLPAMTVFILAAAVFFIIYIPISLKKMHIIINDIEAVFKSGIIILSEKRMRINKIELAYIIRTPFSKYTGLNFVVLCVYGKSLVLPFLCLSDSQEITNIIKKRIMKQ